MRKRKLETCFSPALFEPADHADSIVVIIDILRASSAIVTAFANGVSGIIPVANANEAKDYKSKGYLVAAERDGFVLDFADFGNSPFNFTREKVEGNTIVYSTTNGTGLIELAAGSYLTLVGSFLNLSAVSRFLLGQERDVLLFCAGWKNKFNLEDTVCAGAIAEKLLESNLYSTICDSTYCALDIWSAARYDLIAYIEKSAQRSRLRDKKLDDCIEYCFTADITSKIPVMKNGVLIDILT
jgi:2-phosphosulfolactate phosphatase